jgi:LacI family transcriptional regulator
MKRRASTAGARQTVSIESVAERAGVSISTVSRVVNGVEKRASDATARRVMEAVGALGYRPQSAGRALRQRESRIVGVLVANLSNPAMAAIAASIEAALRDAGYVMALCDTHERAEIQDEYLSEMEAQLARGIVMVVAVPSPKLDAMRASGRPLVFVNRRDPGADDSAFVGIDDFAAGRDLAEHLLEGPPGAAPAVIHASLAFSAGALRLGGVEERLLEAGFKRSQIAKRTAKTTAHLEIGYQAMGQLLALSPRPRNVVCLSDLLAYGAYRRVREAGLRVPDDVALYAFDDNPLNDWIAPWLSAVHMPYTRFGPAVVASLRELLDAKPATQRLLAHEMVLRTRRQRY